jgi:cyclohexa-1,5-dienecarbonyl-CoA hydratase
MSSAKFATVTFEDEGALARVVFDGGRGNVLDRTLLHAIGDALDEAAAPDVRAILIEGAGDHFSFGASVEDHRPEKCRDFLHAFHAFFRRLVERPIVRIAVVRGQCLGGGLELALGCQRIVASPSARLGQPEVKLAVFAPIASLLLPPRIGQPAADDLLLTGRSVSASEALAMRLVDQVADDPLDAAREWARANLTSLSASSLRFAARAAWTASTASLLTRLDEVERIYLDELMQTPDAVEGIVAFLEKRTPSYAGPAAQLASVTR